MKCRISSILTLLALLIISIMPLAAQENDAFPVSIEHKFGTITIEAEPQRIVVLGYTEQDPYFALGADPVAIRYWYGDENAIFPWAEEAADGVQPEVLNMGFGTLNYEALLALEPDLISAVDAGITADEYEALSQIAPTLAQYDTYVDFGMPWQETTRLIGTAIGQADEADALVTDIETRIETIREDNTQFDGQSVAVSYFVGGTYGYYTGQDSRGRFFTDLGFVVPEELGEVAGDSFFANISNERLDLLDQDLLIFLALQFFEDGSEAAREAIEADPLLAQLDAVQDERVLFVSDEFDDALQFSTVLSIEFLLDGLVPELTDIFPPETEMEATEEVSCDEGLRLFDHEMLATDPICVPEEPQAVISLDALSFDLMLAVGQQPAGAVGYLDIVVPANFPYLADQMEGIANMGFPPNLETVLEAEPDLIIITTLDFEIYDELSAIAPTAMYEYDASGEWQESMIFLGELLNLSTEVDQLFEDYYTRLDVLAETLGDPSELDVSVVRILQDSIMLNLVNSFPSVVIADAGLSRPASQAYTVEEALDVYGEEIGVFISFEDLQLADGEHIFIWGQMASNVEDEEQLANYVADANMQALQENPLWQTLSGVQSEQVYPVGGYWVGWGFAAANAIIDDLFIYLAEVDPRDASPNPFRDDIENNEATEEAGD